MKRQMARAKSFGIEFEFISPAEAGQHRSRSCAPTISPARSGFRATARPIPTDLTQSLAKGARQRGATIVEGVEVVGGRHRAAAACAACRVEVRPTTKATIACETIVNCAGQWAREFGRARRRQRPALFRRALLLVTKPIAGVHADLPVIRDPDGFIYYKEEVGGLVMGGFEPEAKPWNVDPIPDGFEFQLLPEDWDQFEILMTQRDPSHAVPRDGRDQAAC